MFRNSLVAYIKQLFHFPAASGLVVFLCGTTLHAATYYVAKDGHDNNPGTLVQPFLTILKGVGTLGSGDTLFIREGIYPERIITGWPDYQKVASGSSWDNATTIAAYNGENVVLQPSGVRPSSDLSPMNRRVLTFFQYVILDGLVLDGTHSGEGGFNIQGGPHHIRMQNCEIKNTYSGGVAIFYGSNNGDALKLQRNYQLRHSSYRTPRRHMHPRRLH
ncbi:MAG: hypothetical protein R3C68_12235 [Myxococcota bacterium]